MSTTAYADWMANKMQRVTRATASQCDVMFLIWRADRQLAGMDAADVDFTAFWISVRLLLHADDALDQGAGLQRLVRADPAG